MPLWEAPTYRIRLREDAAARQATPSFRPAATAPPDGRFRHLTPALSPFEAEREGARTALSFALWLRKTLVGEGWPAHGLGLVFDDARPGAFDAAEAAGEFREIRCGGIGAEGFAGAVEMKAAHFVEGQPGNQFESGRCGFQPSFLLESA